MKKIFISTIILGFFGTNFVFGQSISLAPTNVDEFTVTTFGSGTNSSILGRKAGGSSSSPTATASGTQLVVFGGRGHNGTVFNTSSPAFIAFDASQAFSPTASGSLIRFNTTTNNTTTSAERMRIDNNGFIGIGTSSPDKKLHVSNGSAGIGSYVSSSNFLVEDNTSHYIQMGSPEASETGLLFGKPSASASGGVIYDGNNNLKLRTGGNNTRVTVTSAGNVGIGTTAPTAKLDIEGDIVVKKTVFTGTGTFNALSRSSGSSLFINSVGTVTVNGIAGGVDGMLLYLICGSSATVILANENASATSTDRIATHTGLNVTISGRGGATLIYEASVGKWRIIGVAL